MYSVNNHSMRALRLFNKINLSLSFTFVISSVLLVLSEIMNLMGSRGDGDFSLLLTALSTAFYKMIPFVLCFFVTQKLTKDNGGFKGFFNSFCLACAIACLNAVSTSSSFEFVTALIVTYFGTYLFLRFDTKAAVLLDIISSLLFGVLLGYLSEPFENFIMWLGKLISGKGIFSSVAFSAIDSIFTDFDIDSFKNIFFHKSFGGTMFMNDEIVTGAKDLFSSGYDGKYVSTYLSGHYFSLFLIAGIGASLFKKMKGSQKIVIAVTVICAVLSGNFFLFYILIFLESPFLFLSAVMLNILCFVSSYILNLGMGYILNGSVFEMLMYLDNGVYLFAGGAVFVCIGFFTTAYIIEKHGISDCLNTYIPNRLKNVVTNLGGITNIIRFKDNTAEVRNPKLVNTLELNCEIDENIIKCNSEGFAELKEYI